MKTGSLAVGALVCLLAWTSACAEHLVLVQGKHYRLCQQLQTILSLPQMQPPPDTPACLRKFDHVPPGFPGFTFPQWQPLPASEVTLERAKAIWKAQYAVQQAHGARDFEIEWNEWRPWGWLTKQALKEAELSISRARFDYNFDGTPETVDKMDNAACAEDSESKVYTPNYPVLAVNLNNNRYDPQMVLGTPGNGQNIFFFGGKTYILQFKIFSSQRGIKSQFTYLNNRRIEVRPTAPIKGTDQKEIGYSIRQAPQVCILDIDPDRR